MALVAGHAAASLTWALTNSGARIENHSMSRKRRKASGSPRTSGGTTVEVRCPCCETVLLVDRASGVILRQDRKKKPIGSLEAHLDQEKKRRQASDQAFGKALRLQKDQEALLDRKFEEALKKAADEPDERPVNPLDWD
ncbi:MAG: hypothetical protein ACE5HD_01725 [Acidobacteriota bacterium]